ncbi:hypothetical protein [Mycobacterium gastri]|uniref:hypothetical protein n=1 Tax=Mycobacterium gastri TaxID=1777 RepID=UPI00111BFA95|nr:hypothetical protein [Mycobacterium gastri]
MNPDDPSIDGADTLYWRAPELPLENWTIFDEGRQGHRVRSGAFVWNEDGVSCYLQSVLTDLGLDYLVVKNDPRNGILSVRACDVRECGLGVARDPNPNYITKEELQPRDEAHALIVHDDDVGSKQRKKRTSALAVTALIVHWG